MTFRAKPVANRPQRHSRDSQSRRNLYLNIGFGVAVVSAIVILVGVAAVSYYSDHLSAAATVGGQTITRDDFTEQAQIEVFDLTGGRKPDDRVALAARERDEHLLAAIGG